MVLFSGEQGINIPIDVSCLNVPEISMIKRPKLNYWFMSYSEARLPAVMPNESLKARGQFIIQPVVGDRLIDPQSEPHSKFFKYIVLANFIGKT